MNAEPAPDLPDDPRALDQRDAWVLAHRGPRTAHDPTRPQGWLVEPERAASGEIVPVATIFLTNRECPWRCVMCDLWKGALATRVPRGTIPEQIRYALPRLGPARHLKLYNSGSFFDAGAIPPGDHPAVAQLGCRFERVIVESHPALVGDRCVRFRDRLFREAGREATPPPSLEVAMGLETAHPQVLERLNKRMTLDEFARAAAFLHARQIAVRAFVLVQPPFLAETEAVEWAVRSTRFAFDCGASVVSLIPTRPGNGALEALARRGEFCPPRLATLEAAAEAGVRMRCGRVFADVWDLGPFSQCPACLPARTERLRWMNLSQEVPPRVMCRRCAG